MFVALIVAWVITAVGTTVFWWAAYANLSEYGKQHTLRIMLWSKLFAGRDNFTERGWRYMQWARACALVWPAAVLLLALSWR